MYFWRPPEWPGNPQSDHDSISVPMLISEDSFNGGFLDLKPGDYRLLLSVLHCSGADTRFEYHVAVDKNGSTNIDELNSNWRLQRAESAIMAEEEGAEKLVDLNTIKAEPSPIVQAKLRVLRDLLAPEPNLPMSLPGLSQPNMKVVTTDHAKMFAKCLPIIGSIGCFWVPIEAWRNSPEVTRDMP